MQRDRRKRYSPARHPVLLRRVLLVLCILAVLWLGYSCMMPQLLFSARGTMIFVPDPPLRGSGKNFHFMNHQTQKQGCCTLLCAAALFPIYKLSNTFFPVSGSGMPSSASIMAMRIYTPLCT